MKYSNRNEFDQNRSSIYGHFCRIDNVPITFIEMEKIEMQLMNSDFREIVLILIALFIVCCSKPLLSSDQTFHLHFVVSLSHYTMEKNSLIICFKAFSCHGIFKLVFFHVCVELVHCKLK